MTPEEAIALEPGTTPGPWEAYDPGDGTARMYAGEREEARPLLRNVDSDPHTACVYFTREDGLLIAAAPDMRDTIAAQTWEYGVVRPNGSVIWFDTRRAAEDIIQVHHDRRLARRLVGPVEVVE